MIEYRHAKPEERAAYIAFANMVFTTDKRTLDFEALIPKVYGPERETAHLQNVAVDAEKGIRGLVAVLPGTLYAGETTLRTGYVGTVSVHPQARGEGHMKQLMAKAIAQMTEEGVDVAFLSGQRQRYEYFGFVPGGVRYRFAISDSAVRHALCQVDVTGVTFAPMTPGSEAEALAQTAHAAKPYHFDRNAPDFATVCRTFSAEPWVMMKDGAFVGWLTADKTGASLGEACAETPEALDAMLKAWMAWRGLEEVTLTLPETDWAAVCHLRTWAEGTEYGPSQNIRILHFAHVVETMLRLKASYRTLADGELALDCAGECFTVRVRGGKVQVTPGAEAPQMLDLLAAQRLLLDPFIYEGRPDTPAGWFPLPLYAATADEF